MEPAEYEIEIKKPLFDESWVIGKLTSGENCTKQFFEYAEEEYVPRSVIYLGETKLDLKFDKYQQIDKKDANEKLLNYIQTKFPSASKEGIEKIKLAIYRLTMQAGTPARMNFDDIRIDILNPNRDYRVDIKKDKGYTSIVKIDETGQLTVDTSLQGVINVVDDNENHGGVFSHAISTIKFDKSGVIQGDPTFISTMTSDNPYLQQYMNSTTTEEIQKNKKLLQTYNVLKLSKENESLYIKTFDDMIFKTSEKDKNGKDYIEQFLENVSGSDVFLGKEKLSVAITPDMVVNRNNINEKLAKYITDNFPGVNEGGIEKIRLAICELAALSNTKGSKLYDNHHSDDTFLSACLNLNKYEDFDSYWINMHPRSGSLSKSLSNTIKIDKTGRLTVSTLVEQGAISLYGAECGHVDSILTRVIQFDKSGNNIQGGQPAVAVRVISNIPHVQKYIDSKSEEDFSQSRKIIKEYVIKRIDEEYRSLVRLVKHYAEVRTQGRSWIGKIFMNKYDLNRAREMISNWKKTVEERGISSEDAKNKREDFEKEYKKEIEVCKLRT